MQKRSPKWKNINWRHYNKALIQRGSLLIWISEDVRKKWIERKSKKNGRPKTFSDQAILAVASLRMLFSLPLRAAEGFVVSLFQMIKCSLPVPDYSLVSKRMKYLDLSSLLKTKKRPQVLLIDSSGIKIFGQGEWRAKRFGEKGRKGWLKIHLAVDPETHLIEALQVTTDEIGDAQVLGSLLEETPKSVKTIIADKGYDQRHCREKIRRKGANDLIPPRDGAVISCGDPTLQGRDEAIKICLGLGGDEIAVGLWRKLSGYTKRSLVETAFSRWKTMFGEKIQSRHWENQSAEIYIKQLIMNELTKQGMPRRGKI